MMFLAISNDCGLLLSATPGRDAPVRLLVVLVRLHGRKGRRAAQQLVAQARLVRRVLHRVVCVALG
jgi:hypothetical protein